MLKSTELKPVFYYAPQHLYNTETYDLTANEDLLVATGTKIKLLECNLKDEKEQSFHAIVAIEHPIEFSVYGRENTQDNYKQTIGNKNSNSKSVTITELPLKSSNEISQCFELLIINQALNNLVEAKIIFEKVVYEFENVPRIRLNVFKSKEFTPCKS